MYPTFSQAHRIFIILVLAALWNVPQTAAQSGPRGTITGDVRHSRKPVASAGVRLLSEVGTLESRTDKDGRFRIEDVPADLPFRIVVSRFGFETMVLEDSVSVNDRVNRNFVFDLKRGFLDQGDFDQGWQLGVAGDAATGGIWERTIPLGSREGAYAVQPFEDSDDEGKFCFVTANAKTAEDPAGDADVDGGATTLRSPLFDLVTLENPVLTFSYVYSNDRGGQKGGDFFYAQISSDGGATWVNLIKTSASTAGWKEIQLNLNDFIVSTDSMYLQFIAEDNAPATLVEAAVDKISITGDLDAPEPPRELVLDVQFGNVLLRWKSSEGAIAYNVYVSRSPGEPIQRDKLFATTPDTTLTVPLSTIPFDEFYFTVTAVR